MRQIKHMSLYQKTSVSADKTTDGVASDPNPLGVELGLMLMVVLTIQ